MSKLTVRVGRFASGMVGRGAPERGDDGVVVGVGVVRVVHCWVMAVILQGSFGDADVRFTDIRGTRGLRFASVILLRGPAGAVVVTVPVITACHRGISWRLGKSDLSLVAHLGGLGVAQDIGAFQGAIARKAGRSRAADIVRLLVGGRRDVDGEFRAA